MGAFDAARAVMAANPHRSSAATYVPAGAAGVPVRIVMEMAADDAPRVSAMLPAAGLPFTPRRLDRLEVGEKAYRVENIDRPDPFTFTLTLSTVS